MSSGMLCLFAFADLPGSSQGFDGPLPQTLEELTLDSAQIVFRKVKLRLQLFLSLC